MHFSDIDAILGPIDSVKWWELYATHEVPRRLVLVIIPKIDVKNLEKTILKILLDKMNESNMVFETAYILGELDIIILPTNAFQFIQKEIDKLSKERGASRVKLRRLFVEKNRQSIYLHLDEKYGYDQQMGSG